MFQELVPPALIKIINVVRFPLRAKVDGSQTITFFFWLVYSSWDMKHAITTRWLANPNWSRTHFPHNKTEHMWKILFNLKEKTPILIKRSYKSPPNTQLSRSMFTFKWFESYFERTQSTLL